MSDHFGFIIPEPSLVEMLETKINEIYYNMYYRIYDSYDDDLMMKVLEEQEVTIEEIKENDYNLNIPRYVDTFEPEPEIDLGEVAAEIRKLQSEIKTIDAELKPYFDELGLDFPFDVEGV